jgi:GT2 family glycosyltransferase/glycosyltransferase involved in cell wall biosynthesis
MALGGGDVVLLNSDTIVTAGWLDALQACVAADAHIATATPFSNNGEICSYPVFCRATLADRLAPEAIATAMARLPADAPCPDLPTGVGFCMYIRRQALAELGLFDAERFGAGYGEENDFCQRAIAAGWRNVLCPRAYVLHVGGASFLAQSTPLKARHLQALLERHPRYEQDVREFVAQDPIAPLRAQVADALAGLGQDACGHPPRPAVLLITHDFGGGVEKHVRDLAALLRPAARVEILRPDGTTAVQLEDDIGSVLRWPAQDLGGLRALLERRRYDRLHVHHLHGFPAALPDLIQALGRPFDLTLHDFGIYCPQYALTTADGNYCGEPDLAGCQTCVAERPHAWGLDVPAWRTRWGRLAAQAQRVIAPSAFVRDRVLRHFPALPIQVWPHPPRLDWTPARPRPLKVLVLGGLSRPKGLDTVLACARHAQRAEQPLAFVLLGYPEHAVPQWPDLPLQVRGEYHDADLPTLAALERADVVCFPGRIPETHSYTLDVALGLGLPIVASDLGAIAERLHQRPGATLLPALAPAADWNAALLQATSLPTEATTPATDTRETYAQKLRGAWQGLGAPALVQPLALAEPGPAQPPPPTPARQLGLMDLYEHGVDCGHGASRLALRQRLQEITTDQQVLQAFGTRQHRPWYEAITELEAEVPRLQARLAEMDTQARELAEARAYIDELLHSTSWRVTAPLRDSKAWWRAQVGPKVHQLQRALRLARRWPLAWRILRDQGPAALWQRIRQKLRPPAPPQRPSLAPPLRAIGPLHLETCPADRTPRVSIVIPTYGQHLHTFNCLLSLKEHTDLAQVEVIAVDDTFAQPLTDALAQTTGVHWLRNPENLGFIGSCRVGSAQARGDFVLLLNNDVQVCAGWLDALLEVFERHPDAGLAGARLVYPDGSLQEAGGIVWRDGSGWNWGRGQDPEHPHFRYLREADYCSGACLLLRRTDWLALEGFDRAYAPAYYEDTDLAMRVRARGQKVFYQPEALVIHHEGITSGTDLGQGVKKHQVINQKTFFERWRTTLAGHRPNGEQARREADRGTGAWVLVVEACMVTPDQDSGSVRMLAMLEILRELGCKVAFVADNLEYRQPYVRQLQQLGVEVWHTPHVSSVEQLLEREGALFSHIMFCRHYIAAPYMQAVRRHAPQAKVWFDTVDLHYLREQRMAELEKDDKLLQLSTRTREQELGVIRQADVTLVVSPVEQELLARETPGAQVAVLSNIHEPVADTPGFDGRDGLLFVGGFQHPPNIDAVQWFLSEVWPIIQVRAPHIRVRIVGSKMPDSLRQLASPGVEILGFVADLDPLLARSKVSIAPLRYGAGVKGKVNQAMAHGLPVVATQTGVEGMHLLPDTEVLVAQDPTGFAEAVLRLHEDRELWERLAQGGKNNIERTFSRRVARETLRGLL